MSGRTPRHGRTRHGCERCRRQHRKCDEQKPVCTRCLNAKSICKYLSHITFRPENITSGPSALESKGVETPSSYTRIKFLAPGKTPASSSRAAETSENSPETRDQKVSGQHSNLTPQADASQPADGARNSTVALAPTSYPVDGHLEQEDFKWPLVGKCQLSAAEASLMKYFCHHTAPWIDVYDEQHRPFTTIVPRLALNSPCILDPLLRLAAASSHLQPDMITHRKGLGLLHLKHMITPPGAESPFAAVRVMAAFGLEKARQFTTQDPVEWKSTFHGGGAFPDWYPDMQNHDVEQKQVWDGLLVLLCRLVIAWALISQHGVGKVVQLLQKLSASVVSKNPGKSDVRAACLRCLELLARCLNLCFGDTPDGEHAARGARPAAQTRLTLLDDLRTWYANRLPSLKAVFEPDTDWLGDGRAGALAATGASDARHAPQIFTSAAGISTAVLYHSAMALLYIYGRSKNSERRGDSTMEADAAVGRWHSRQIWSIMQDHDPRYIKYWDPCMTAALALATQHLPNVGHAGRAVVVEFLSGIETLGWNVNSLRGRLQSA
ncbi:uncharacterized protein B0I36DRAFT_312808 [Microdochium trichocladiopsis]|uniref:Zn(2)-C6 fungal-type domain-containing protein n=1 Tax=Microdochium trichocladiopsis TaxID=1682393 RepID=A0A9P8YJ25_9PEZI|nr:uncharacterized protein B0I36DRAFT_312808 [Microdochium trichocladiopsis]KAH7041421.1 hypothetical protein B0I36DRAFT_312808 [Microdochium trichocladiopsis]